MWAVRTYVLPRPGTIDRTLRSLVLLCKEYLALVCAQLADRIDWHSKHGGKFRTNRRDRVAGDKVSDRQLVTKRE